MPNSYSKKPDSIVDTKWTIINPAMYKPCTNTTTGGGTLPIDMKFKHSRSNLSGFDLGDCVCVQTFKDGGSFDFFH